MSDPRRFLAVLAALVLLPFCGYRERGLEVAIDMSAPSGCSAGTLDIERIELLPCPDVPVHVALFDDLVSIHVARAHDLLDALGPMSLVLPTESMASTLRISPGSYCDVRLHFGGPTTPALSTVAGMAPEREAVLRLVDETGAPTRLLFATAPDRAEVSIALGAFSDADEPAHALSLLIDGASATVRAEPRSAE